MIKYIYLILGIVLVLIYILIKKIIFVFKVKKRFDKAIKQEKEAKELLINKGYKVLDYQYEIVYNIRKNKEKIKIRVSPDYVVKKNGKKYVAEVKTGMVANIKNRHTRRQILEYYHGASFGTLLVDMNRNEIIEIKFEDKSKMWKKLTVIMFFITVILLVKIIQDNEEIMIYIMKNIKKVYNRI